jgi:xyloglucan:xyloglucosyl transferase
MCSVFSIGSGLVSQNRYSYGFFSAAIKLPAGLSPGVVVAFYVSYLLN